MTDGWLGLTDEGCGMRLYVSRVIIYAAVMSVLI